MFENETPRDECGVFGLYRHHEAAKLTYFGLYALQHRGQESAGISVSRENNKIISHKGMGLVHDIFKMEDLERIEGGSAIGHVRYSTTGDSVMTNAQPFVVQHKNRSYAVAH
ncbi:MAG: amidophosphoribosyltransferase, partial [Desulfobacterium sp.]|nr:amidophosphoribosyltransferase [Desulfobacterium sp.]